jgi:hypothetical protein
MNEPRYCERCGRSRVPLDVPHLSHTCVTCGETAYFVRPGDGGQGLKVEAGEQLTIPAGALTISLDPTRSNGRFSPIGVTWFVESLIGGQLAASDNDIRKYLTTLDGEADAAIAESQPEPTPNRQTRDQTTARLTPAEPHPSSC